MFRLLIVMFGLIATVSYGQCPPFSVDDPAAFFGNIDLNYPGLEQVKLCVEKNNYADAVQKYVEFFSKRTDRRFMYNGNDRDQMVSDLRTLYPDHEKEVIRKASDVSQYRIEIEGRKCSWPDGNIVWNEQNKEWINVLNRMQYMTDLGLAYWYTKDETYFKTFWHWFSDWFADNPVPNYQPQLTGGTWSPLVQSYTAPHGAWRALEVGIRMENLISTYYYFENSPEFTTQRKWQFLRSLMEHSKYIYGYLSRGALGNWEVSAASGFLQLAVLTPEWKNSEQLLAFSKNTLNTNFKRALNDEGFQFELTLGYHKHVVPQGIKMQYLLEKLNGLDGFDNEAYDKIKKSYQLVANLKKPNNQDPSMGDMEFPFSGEDKETVAGDPFFSNAVILLEEPVYKSLAGRLSPTDYICFGQRGYKLFQQTSQLESPTLSSIYLPTSKLAVMRSGSACMDSTYSSLYCLFDNSPDGVGSHSHHDFLNIELFAYDKTLIIDPGRGTSYNDSLFFPYYRAVKGHNVVQVGTDGTQQQRKRPGSDAVRNEAWVSHPTMDYAKGVMEDNNGARHCRELLFIKGEYWFLRDKLTGDGEQIAKQYFHTPQSQVVINNRTKAAFTNLPSCANLLIIPAIKESVDATIEKGYMGHDGKNLETPIVTYSKRKKFPITFENILFPLKSGEPAPRFKITALSCDQSNDINSYYAFRFEIDGASQSAKDDYFYVSEGDKPVSFSDKTSLNGTVAVCRKRDGRPYYLFLKGRMLNCSGFAVESDDANEVFVQRKDRNTYLCNTKMSTRLTLLCDGAPLRVSCVLNDKKTDLQIVARDKKSVTVLLSMSGEYQLTLE